MENVSILKKRAKTGLKINIIPICITLLLIGIIPFIVGVIEHFVTSPIEAEIEILLENLEKTGVSNSYLLENYNLLMSANMALSLWTAIFSLVELFVFCFELSICAMFLLTAQNEKYRVRDFKDAFTKIKESFTLNLLMSVKIFLWSLLFIIPGIIKFFSYAMANHVRLEEPELSSNECLKKSEEMMMGRKGDLFGLYISFIGWAFLHSAIVYGLSYLYSLIAVDSVVLGIIIFAVFEFVAEMLYLPLEAYIGVADAHFYLELVRDEEKRKQESYDYDDSAYQEYMRKKQAEEGPINIFDYLDGRDDFYKKDSEPFAEFSDTKEENQDQPFGDF